MTRTEIMAKLAILWPKKYPEEELKRMAARFESEPDLEHALHHLKDYSKYTPKVSEIEKALLARSWERRTQGTNTDQPKQIPFSETIRKHLLSMGRGFASDGSDIGKMDAFELIIRHYRQGWARYERVQLEARGTIPAESPTLALFDQQFIGQQTRERHACMNALVGEGLSLDWAKAAGEAVTGDDTHYRTFLDDLRRNLRELRYDAEQAASSGYSRVA